jgi:1A family penicillin-binding protein
MRSPGYWRSPRANKKLSISKNTRGWLSVFKKKWTRWFFLSCLFVGLIGLLGTIVLFVWVSKDLPEPGKLLQRLIPESTKIYDRTGENLLYEIHGDQKRTLIKLEEIPDYTIKAFIALEDKTFFEHQGLSLKHIFKAVVLYGFQKIGLYNGVVPGGSTLTQQLVKNSILTNEKTVTRKIKEWLLSYQLEKKFTKNEILLLYFNEIPFGSTAYGIESAAQTYLGKSTRDLSLGESALLAAMIQAPTYYSPYGNHVEELLSRQRFAVDEMLKAKYITEQQAQEAKNEKFVFKKSLENIKAPHFVLYVKELLTTQYGERIVEQGGLKVITTLDIYKQKIAEEVLKEQADKNATDWGASNASLVSLDPKTGEILALVGSKDFYNEEIDGQVNVAIRPRQPGSSFKPIVYTAAWEKGYVPETVVFDVVTKFKTEIGKDYEPHNYDNKERGPISLKQALQGSLNIPAVKVLYLVGVQNVLDLAEKLGYSTFTDRSRFGLSLVLGGGEVKLLEHTSAFGTLAREGKKQPTIAILKVLDNDNKVLFENTFSEGEQVIDQKIARITNSVLSDDSARAYIFGSGGILTLPNRPVAVKTGTTNDYRDAWTIGYTPSLVTGVWVGNNDYSEMKRGADGSIVAAPIWHNYMNRVLQNTPVEIFNKPEYQIPDKPMLNGSKGAETKITIDKISGFIATDLTPNYLREEKTFSELHNILYFVDKDNPLGPMPGQNSTDPQYENWESSVQRWAKENGQINTSTPPTQLDNIHTTTNKPSITILDPWSEQNVSSTFTVRLEWETIFPFQKLEFYLDDNLIKTINQQISNPFISQITFPSNYFSGDHYLKVVISDQYDNSELDWLKIIKQ